MNRKLGGGLCFSDIGAKLETYPINASMQCIAGMEGQRKTKDIKYLEDIDIYLSCEI